MLGDSLYLDNIEEYVQDEDKIVTYKWLSRNLEVPVNVAKQMLYSYVSRCQKRSSHQLSVTYLVTGVDDYKGHQVRLVEENNLEDTKKQFTSLLGVHIYSVQKSQLKDSSVLYAADYDVGEEHIQDYSRWSTIECPVGVKQAASGRKHNAQAKASTNPPLPKLSKPQKISDEDSKQSVRGGVQSQATKRPEQLKQGKVQSSNKPKPAAKGTMMSFFGKDNGGKKMAATVKKEAKPVTDPPPSKVIESTPSPPAPSIESPAKHTGTKSPATSGPSKPTTTKGKASEMFPGLNDSDIDDEDSEEERPPVKPAKQKAVKAKAKGRGRGRAGKVTKQEHVKGKEQPTKRRRVQELSSDEEASDNEFKGNDKSAAKPDSAKEGVVKRRKKVKRLVPKMYTNDEGEMVTERSWEMVSTDASDEEDSLPAEKTVKVESQAGVKIEKVSPKKTKQATLMSFFKK